MTTIYVGNLPVDAEATTLERIFGRYGEVTDVRLFPESATVRKRAYGLVEMPGRDEARKASRLLNGQTFRGHFLTVRTVARPLTEVSGRDQTH